MRDETGENRVTAELNLRAQAHVSADRVSACSRARVNDLCLSQFMAPSTVRYFFYFFFF